MSITPDGEEIDAGDSVDFTAEVSGGPGGELNFRWGGDGLDSRSGRSVTYRFPDKGRKTVHVTVSKGGADVGVRRHHGVRRSQAGRRRRHRRFQHGERRRGLLGLEHVLGQHRDDPLLHIADLRLAQRYTQHALDLARGDAGRARSGASRGPGREVAGDLLADTTPIPPAGSTGADAGLPDTPEEAADESELAISGAVVAAGWRRSSSGWAPAGSSNGSVHGAGSVVPISPACVGCCPADGCRGGPLRCRGGARIPVLVLALLALAVVVFELGGMIAELVRRRGRGVQKLDRAVGEARQALAGGDTGQGEALAISARGEQVDARRPGIDRRPAPAAGR